MMNFINSIPNSIGWTMVGFVLAIDVMLISVLVKYAIDYFKDEEEEEIF